MNPTAKITSSHLSRLAIVYVRQSTVAQVRFNTESTNRQYGVTGTAAELGWLAEQIVVVDADLGVSGRFGAERDGYRQIVARMCLGEVGAVFALEVSHLGRSNADLTRPPRSQGQLPLPGPRLRPHDAVSHLRRVHSG